MASRSQDGAAPGLAKTFSAAPTLEPAAGYPARPARPTGAAESASAGLFTRSRRAALPARGPEGPLPGTEQAESRDDRQPVLLDAHRRLTRWHQVSPKTGRTTGGEGGSSVRERLSPQTKGCWLEFQKNRATARSQTAGRGVDAGSDHMDAQHTVQYWEHGSCACR